MQRTGDLPGVGSVNQVIRQSKLRCIEEIENLASQLHLSSLFDFEVLEDGEIDIVESGSAEGTATRVAEHRGVCGSSRRRRLAGSNGGKSKGSRVIPAVKVLTRGST